MRARGASLHLDGVIGSDVVLVDGLEPSDVVVAVRHQVNVQLAGHHPHRRVVRDVHRLGHAHAPHGSGEGEEQPEPHGAHGRRRTPPETGAGRDGLRRGAAGLGGAVVGECDCDLGRPSRQRAERSRAHLAVDDAARRARCATSDF
jgi:hypothetical protein